MGAGCASGGERPGLIVSTRSRVGHRRWAGVDKAAARRRRSRSAT
jgi:hypothetical protein